MPVVVVRLRGAKEIQRGLNALSKSLRSGTSNALGRRLGREGVRLLGKLTPKNESGNERLGSTRRGFRPLSQQWELIEQVSKETQYVALIRNRASLTKEGVAVLASIEFGAKPHKIPAGGASLGYPLTWVQQDSIRLFIGRSTTRGRNGREVTRDTLEPASRDAGHIFAHTVNHPGNQPFRMVQQTRESLERLAQEFLTAYARDLMRLYGDGLKINVS